MKLPVTFESTWREFSKTYNPSKQTPNSHQRHNRKLDWFTFLPQVKTTKKGTHVRLPGGLIIVAFFLALISTAILGWRHSQISSGTTEQEMMGLISNVIELPNETPQIAIVSDVELLDQPFFAQAQNGDYVIVYQQSGKVLLYRPSSKKVINFANIQIPQSETNLLRTQ